MNTNQIEKLAKTITDQDASPAASPLDDSSTFIKMESVPDRKHDDDNSDDNLPGNLPAEIPVTDPLTPIPMQDEVKPPLQATLGGDDVVIPLDKK